MAGLPELPTVEQILAVKGIKTEFQLAWNESFTSKTHCREQGGFVYAGSHTP